MWHYRCRFVKRIDEQKVITSGDFGSMYPDGRKTFKVSPTIEDAVAAVKQYNPTRGWPHDAVGLVVIQHESKGSGIIAKGSIMRPHIKRENVRAGTTKWLRFINAMGEVFELHPEKHTILRRLS